MRRPDPDLVLFFPLVPLSQLVNSLPNAAAVVLLTCQPDITLRGGAHGAWGVRNILTPKEEDPFASQTLTHLEEQEDIALLRCRPQKWRLVIMDRPLERGDNQVLGRGGITFRAITRSRRA